VVCVPLPRQRNLVIICVCSIVKLRISCQDVVGIVSQTQLQRTHSDIDPSLQHVHVRLIAPNPFLFRGHQHIMSLAVSRMLLRRPQVGRMTLRHASTTSEATSTASSKAKESASSASQGLSKVTSSAGSGMSKAGQTAGNAINNIGGRVGKLISIAQCMCARIHPVSMAISQTNSLGFVVNIVWYQIN